MSELVLSPPAELVRKPGGGKRDVCRTGGGRQGARAREPAGWQTPLCLLPRSWEHECQGHWCADGPESPQYRQCDG